MEFESVEQTAKRLQVTTRTVQKWAKAGKIPGACQMGRTWLIPCGFMTTDALKTVGDGAWGELTTQAIEGQDVAEMAAASQEDDWSALSSEEMPKTELLIPSEKIPPLIDAIFEPGKCLACIEQFPAGAEKDILMAQYYYFHGQTREAVDLSEQYLEHENTIIALTAAAVYCLASLGQGKIHHFRIGEEHIRAHAKRCMREEEDSQEKAYTVYITMMVHLLLHIPCPPLPPLEHMIHYLPMGARLHAGYLLAHEAYLAKDYTRCLGIAEMALAFCGNTYPISSIYLHLMISVALVNLRRTVEARAVFDRAWALAQPDGLTTIFGEHLGLLHGLLEVSLKKSDLREYHAIVQKAEVYSDSWRKVHNAYAGRTVTDQLTPVETAVATLFHRGWSVKEISSYMETSPRMIRYHISMVYEKLGISHREELAQYMVL